jgi:hypothetical protein
MELTDLVTRLSKIDLETAMEVLELEGQLKEAQREVIIWRNAAERNLEQSTMWLNKYTKLQDEITKANE